MNAEEQNGLKELLRQALPPVNSDVAPRSDLWLAMRRRMEAKAAPVFSGWALFDGALLVSLVGLVAVFPASIPLFHYYL